MNSVVLLFLREGSQVEPGASVGSGLGGAILPHRQSCNIFLGTVLHALGQTVLPNDQDVCREGWVWSCSLLWSFLPDLKAAGWRNGQLRVVRKSGE